MRTKYVRMKRKEGSREGGREDVHDLPPELAGGKAPVNDDSATGGKGGEEACDEAVDVEKGHDQESAVGGGELVGGLGKREGGGGGGGGRCRIMSL